MVRSEPLCFVEAKSDWMGKTSMLLVEIDSRNSFVRAGSSPETECGQAVQCGLYPEEQFV